MGEGPWRRWFNSELMATASPWGGVGRKPRGETRHRGIRIAWGMQAGVSQPWMVTPVPSSWSVFIMWRELGKVDVLIWGGLLPCTTSWWGD